MTAPPLAERRQDRRTARRAAALAAAIAALLALDAREAAALFAAARTPRGLRAAVRRLVRAYRLAGSAVRRRWLLGLLDALTAALAPERREAATVALRRDLERAARVRARALAREVGTATARAVVRAVREAQAAEPDAQPERVAAVAAAALVAAGGAYGADRARRVAEGAALGLAADLAFWGARAAGATHKTWLWGQTRHPNEPRVMHRRMHGLTIPIDGVFPNGLVRPHAPGAPVSETAHCSCAVRYS